MRRAIVIGGTGTIGSELIPALRSCGFTTISLSRGAADTRSGRFDITQHELLDAVPDLTQDDSVVILAAHSDQRWVSENAELARIVNVEATQRVADATLRRGATLVFMSSSAVFGAPLHGIYGWHEESHPSPRTEYGRQKAEMEQFLKGRDRVAILRTGWNVPWNVTSRCVIKTTYEMLLRGDARIDPRSRLTLSDVRETCFGITRLLDLRLTGTYHLAGAPFSRVALADYIMSVSENSAAMTYQPYPLELCVSEASQAPDSCLDSRRTQLNLSLEFSNWRDVVTMKVSLLDEPDLPPTV